MSNLRSKIEAIKKNGTEPLLIQLAVEQKELIKLVQNLDREAHPKERMMSLSDIILYCVDYTKNNLKEITSTLSPDKVEVK